MTRTRMARDAVLVSSILMIGVFTLPPAADPNWVRFSTEHLWSTNAADFLRNVLLFVPLGMALRRRRGLLRTVVLACLVSGTVELLQFALVRGRDASVLDVLSNTVGALLGAALFEYRTLLLYPTASSARWLSGLALVTWCVIFVGTSQLLRPWCSAPPYLTKWP